MSDLCTIEVNGKKVEVEGGPSLLRELLKKGYDIPHLCYHEKVSVYGACRLCLVEVERKGRRKVVTSCDHPVFPDMKVFLDTDEVKAERSTVFEVLLAQAPQSEKLKSYAARYGVHETTMKIQKGKCILCGLCERVCREVIGANAIDFAGRGAGREITTPYEELNTECIGCGACAYVCPTSCIQIEDDESTMTREIRFIHAKHELQPCRVCGRPVTTKAHVEYLRKKGLDEVAVTTCEDCKKKEYARLVAFQGHM